MVAFSRRVLQVAFCLSILSPAADPSVRADWPSWRGPDQNGISPETGLIDSFNPKGGPDSQVIWKSEIAAGISTPIVMDGRLFTIVRNKPDSAEDAEKVIALDAETGELLWENVYNVFLSDVPAERIGWSNVTGDPETQTVFTLGACCYLQCIDAASGKTVWAKSLSEEFGMLSTYGGRTNTPVVFEDLVIISGVTTGWDETARPAHRFFAFEKRSGTLVWWTSTRPLPEDTTYSTPVIKSIGGTDVMVTGSGDGSIYGIAPRTGKILWDVPISRRGVNTSVAVGDDGSVYATHGEENLEGTAMGAVVKIDAAAAASSSAAVQRWRTEELMVGKSSPLLVGDRLYVVEDSSRLHVLDAHTGQEIGRPIKLGTAMRGSLLMADGKIYGCSAQGIFHVMRPTHDGVRSIFKVRLPSDHDVGGSPIASGGRIYLPTTGGLFCLGNQDAANESGSNEIVGSGGVMKEDLPRGDVDTLQLVPAEAIVTPGQSVSLKLSAFDQQGQRLSEQSFSEVRFEVSGPASIANGVLTVDPSASHQAVYVTATDGKRSAKSRFRVIPPLPWMFDFADGEVPVTWIGARYRHEAQTVDGEQVIVKLSTIPKGTRSQTWFGPADLSNLTITADVQALRKGEKLPDMGVIAQRYVLDFMGQSQKLQVRTWTAQVRMAKSQPTKMEAGVWYTLKLKTQIEDSNAVLSGKVWPRDESEPADWTLLATDPSPNLVGSPGLFGNATNAEILIDNVRVTANE